METVTIPRAEYDALLEARAALADLAEAGLVHPRRGAGVFVAHVQTAYPLGRRVRFHRNLDAAGQAPTKRVLSLEARNADPREAASLGLAPGERVQVCEGLGLADGVPIALYRSVFPAARFPRMLEILAQNPSITNALGLQGAEGYTRSHTEITATRASQPIAMRLQIRTGDPILRTVSVNSDPLGAPVEYGRTWFAGDRVALTVAST
jgi:GntR family phosphonate transport system transcriptional regulator